MNNLLNEFQGFRKILCVCPCCNEIVRVSDLRIKVKGVIAKTWLDEYERSILKIEKREEKFEKIAGKLRDIAIKKGDKQAEKIFNQAISPAFKILNLNPHDVIPILNPVDFVVFKGMDDKEDVSDIIFLSKQSKYPPINSVRDRVKASILNKKYDWQVARINDEGKIEFE